MIELSAVRTLETPRCLAYYHVRCEMRYLAWLVAGVSVVLGFGCADGATHIASVKADASTVTINISRGTMGPRECTAVFLVRRGGKSLNEYSYGIATINSSKVQCPGASFDIVQCSLDMNQRWSSQLIANSRICTLPPFKALLLKRRQIKIPRSALSVAAVKALGTDNCGVVVVVGDRMLYTPDQSAFQYAITAHDLI